MQDRLALLIRLPLSTAMEKPYVADAVPVLPVDEKQSIASGGDPSSTAPTETCFQRFTNVLKTWGVETHGFVYSLVHIYGLLTVWGRIEPIPLENQTERRTYQLFFFWLSTNLSILRYVPLYPRAPKCDVAHTR